MAFLDMSLETFTRILDEPSEISHEHSKVLIKKDLHECYTSVSILYLKHSSRKFPNIF